MVGQASAQKSVQAETLDNLRPFYHAEHHAMALSDSCFEFLHAISEASEELARQVHWYSAPDYPLQYGAEIDALRRACAAAKEAPYDPESLIRVVRLAHSVMRYLDTPPRAEKEDEHRAEMTKLIHALQKELDAEDAAAVPAVVEEIVRDTPHTPKAAQRLKDMLSKLGKPSYDVVIKIVGDVASATVKKMLGL